MTSIESSNPRTPGQILGFTPGDPGRLASWTEIRGVCDEIAATSNLVSSFELGHDWSGQSIPAYVIANADTQMRLEEYQQRSVADRDNLEKRIVLVTASIHATETGGSHMIPRLLHELATTQSEPTSLILDHLITIFVPSINPGGTALVHEWYEKTKGTTLEGSLPPFADHPVGHDINRDWIMLTQPETRALHANVFRRWRPHLHLDLHEMHTSGPRYSLPPYIDPIDPHLGNEVIELSDEIGGAVAEALRSEGQRGIATRTFFDAFSPARSYVNYHGGVRILAEAAAAKLATTIESPAINRSGAEASNALVFLSERRAAWNGGTWSFHDLVELHLSATRTMLTHIAKRQTTTPQIPVSREVGHGWLVLPYLLQRDPDATRGLLDVLFDGEVVLERIDSPVFLNGVSIPAGSFHLPPDQPFIDYANTLLEPTVYPGAELSTATKVHVPYDVTAHSLPLLMGVDVIALPAPLLQRGTSLKSIPKAVGWIASGSESSQFAMPATSNASARIVNTAFQLGATVSRITQQSDALPGVPQGGFVIGGIDRPVFERLLRDSGVIAQAIRPSDEIHCDPLAQPNVGIYRGFAGEFEDSGWTKHVLDEFGFESQFVNDRTIQTESLDRFTAIVLPSQRGEDIRYGLTGSDYPEEYRGGLGSTGIDRLRLYIGSGGTLIALGAACDAALTIIPSAAFNRVSSLTTDQFQTPGAIVRLELNQNHPLNWGLESPIAAMITNTPVFAMAKSGDTTVTEIARFPEDDLLLAGWINGQHYLQGRSAMIELRFGAGRAYLLGCRPQFRGMAQGTYRLLFNAIYASVLHHAYHRNNDEFAT